MNKQPVEMLVRYYDNQMLASGLMEDYIIQVLCQRYREFCDDFINIHVIPYGDVPYCFNKSGKKIKPLPETFEMSLQVTEKQLCDFFGYLFKSKFAHERSDKYIFFHSCELVNDRFELVIGVAEIL